MTAVFLISMGTSSIASLSEGSSDISDQGCDFEQRQVITDKVTPEGYSDESDQRETMSSRCDDQGEFDQTDQRVGIVHELNLGN